MGPRKIGRKRNVKSVVLDQKISIPEFLIYDPYFKGLPHSAMICYGILSKRNNVSIKNNWIDKNGDIYLNYSQEELAKVLNCDTRTVRNYLKALIEYGLIKKEAAGNGKVDRIYILDFTEDDFEEEFIEEYKQNHLIEENIKEEQLKKAYGEELYYKFYEIAKKNSDPKDEVRFYNYIEACCKREKEIKNKIFNAQQLSEAEIDKLLEDPYVDTNDKTEIIINYLKNSRRKNKEQQVKEDDK